MTLDNISDFLSIYFKTEHWYFNGYLSSQSNDKNLSALNSMWDKEVKVEDNYISTEW